MRRLQVWIGLVLRMPRPVVRQRHDLMDGLVVAAQLLAHSAAIACRAILVDVVPEVDHGVDPALRPALGDLAIGVEITERPVRARHHGHTVIARAFSRQCPRGPAWRRRPTNRKPVVVQLPWLEPLHIHLDRVVALRTRIGRPALDDILETGIPGHTPGDRHRAGCFRRHPCPDQDAGLGGITRGDSMLESPLCVGDLPRCGACGCPETRNAQSKRTAPSQPGHGFILPAGLLAPLISRDSLPCSASRRKHDVSPPATLGPDRPGGSRRRAPRQMAR